jgi:hypothetical protein
VAGGILASTGLWGSGGRREGARPQTVRSPVLFLVFNRPESTAQVFAAVRAAKPPRLYVAADGARPEREGEDKRCAEARWTATAVNWPCRVQTLFQDHNLGPKRGPVAGITWFFEHETEGIILEDDIQPLPSFFPYCEDLLERYRDDQRVGVISGSNLVAGRFAAPDSYFFSRYLSIWGWASWRRVWQHYDPEVREWPAWRDRGGLHQVSDGNRAFESYWRSIFERAYTRDVDWWSYQLQLVCWMRGLLVAMPAVSQTMNLGFGDESTHTRGRVPGYIRESAPQPVTFPLRHPPRVAYAPEADRLIGRRVHGLSPVGSTARRLNSIKVFVRHIPVVGDLLRGAQLRLVAAGRLVGRLLGRSRR